MRAKEIRAKARAALNNRWTESVIAGAIAALGGGIITGATFLPGALTKVPMMTSGELTERAARVLQSVQSIQKSPYTMLLELLGVVAFLIGGAIEIGYADYLLHQNDGHGPTYRVVLSAFDRFGTGFVQKLLRAIKTFLWSLLLGIPGLVAHYRYAMTPFILAEHPDMTAGEAIRESKRLMKGHKWALFLLDLSFIGWQLLAGLTMNLGNLALNPYRGAAHAAFYRDRQRAA